MGRSIVSILALVLVSLIAVNAVATPVVHAVAPIVLLGIGALVGGALGGIIGYWLGQTHGAVQAAYDQYKHDVDRYTQVVMSVYNDGYYKMMVQMENVHGTFVNKTANYYIRWAESISSSVCNQNKSAITDEDLKPILDDLAKIVENYVKHFLRSFYDLYRKGWDLSKLREKAGLADSAIWFIYSLCGWVDPGGKLCGADLSTMRIDPLGYVDRDGSITVFAENITKMLVGEISNDVRTIIERVDGFEYDIVGYTVGGSVEEFLEKVIRDFRVLYHHAKSSANIYCEVISTIPVEPLPPPSIGLPYDVDTLNKLDPQAKMTLYITYLNTIAQNDWEKVSELAPANVSVADERFSIKGALDLDFDGEPDVRGNFTIAQPTFRQYFKTNSSTGICGLVYWEDENGKLQMLNVKCQPPPANYTIVGEIETPPTYPYKLYVVEWVDEQGILRRGIGVDIDKDGKIDYVAPLLFVESIKDVNFDSKSGTYEEKDVEEAEIGPTPVDEWVEIKLKEVGGLEYKDTSGFSLGFSLEGVRKWWTSLDLKMKALIVGAVLVLLIVVVMAAGGSRVVVVGRR